MHIAVVYSEPTSRVKNTSFVETEEDTVMSAIEVANALRKKKYEVTLVPISEHSIKKISSIKADCIFDLIDWTSGDLPLAKKAVQAIENTGIPFTGATWKNYLMVCDKVLSKRAFDREKIPTPRWQQFKTGGETVRKDFQYPVIVKLSLEHCSIGLEHDGVVHDAKTLQDIVQERVTRFKQTAYAEEFIEGRELQVTLLEVDGKVKVLPPAEIVFDEEGDRAFLTYKSRWDVNDPDYSLSGVTVAKLTPAELKKTETLCKRIFTNLGYRDYARMDLRMRGADLFVLEANCNPGLGDCVECAITVSYKAAGMNFADFIDAIVASCMRRFKKK